MADKPKNRVYTRTRGGTTRYYGDFRDFRDVGGKREALIPEGHRKATSDPDVAQSLAAQRVRELKREQRQRESEPETYQPPQERQQRHLQNYASRHLVETKREGKAREQHLDALHQRLSLAVEFFGPDKDISEIRPSDVKRWWLDDLKQRRGTRGTRFSDGTIRHYLNALSGLFRRAVEEEIVTINPVAALSHKPTGRRREARWLEISDAALFLESARSYEPDLEQQAIPFPYPLIASFLLTGGRKSEVLGLEVEDVSFDRKVITFRPNRWRKLKTRTSHRTIPLWPQLEEILREYIYGGSTPRVSGLLFPSTRVKGEGMITDMRKLLDTIGERAGFAHGEVRTKVFRHTYTTARLQTLDRGHPVSVWTVSRELGHSSTTLIEQRYGHLGNVRHRSEVVEYRVEQHRVELGERLTALVAMNEEEA